MQAVISFARNKPLSIYIKVRNIPEVSFGAIKQTECNTATVGNSMSSISGVNHTRKQINKSFLSNRKDQWYWHCFTVPRI